jgi:hypothetical protein
MNFDPPSQCPLPVTFPCPVDPGFCLLSLFWRERFLLYFPGYVCGHGTPSVVGGFIFFLQKRSPSSFLGYVLCEHRTLGHFPFLQFRGAAPASHLPRPWTPCFSFHTRPPLLPSRFLWVFVFSRLMWDPWRPCFLIFVLFLGVPWA